MVGEYLIERCRRIPVEVEIASEFRYRNMPPRQEHPYLRHQPERRNHRHAGGDARGAAQGAPRPGDLNNVASTIARESDGGIYLHAGPEIGVAATKSFTSQVTITDPAGAAISGGCATMSYGGGMKMIEELQALPDKISRDPGAERADQVGSRRSIPRRRDACSSGASTTTRGDWKAR